MKIENFKTMEPMKYYDCPLPKTDSAKQKRLDMIENKDDQYIATTKNDGDWGLFIHYEKDNNLIRSRSISKVTGEYGNYTAKLPHLIEEMNKWPDNTVILAEICWNEPNTTANTVGTILRCLPEKAVERQKDKKLKAVSFDILMLDNIDLTAEKYEKRLQILSDFISKNKNEYILLTNIFTSDFAEHADEIINKGGEGIVIQKKSNPYMPGTRTAWATLKMKQTLPLLELKVINTVEPNRDYDGICGENWQYWEGVYNDTKEKVRINHAPGNIDKEVSLEWSPVTKSYYMGWKNGIVVDYNGVAVKVASGLTDEDREWLATEEAANKIKNGELYAVIKAMSTNSRASLRHPALVRLRDDM